MKRTSQPEYIVGTTPSAPGMTPWITLRTLVNPFSEANIVPHMNNDETLAALPPTTVINIADSPEVNDAAVPRKNVTNIADSPVINVAITEDQHPVPSPSDSIFSGVVNNNIERSTPSSRSQEVCESFKGKSMYNHL